MKLTQIIVTASAVAVLAGCTSARQQWGSARAVRFEQLPAEAQATINKEVGDRHIARITQETKFGRPSYRVEVDQPWINPTLWVNNQGAIVKESDRLVAQRDYRVNEPAGAQAPTNAPIMPGTENRETK